MFYSLLGGPLVVMGFLLQQTDALFDVAYVGFEATCTASTEKKACEGALDDIIEPPEGFSWETHGTGSNADIIGAWIHVVFRGGFRVRRLRLMALPRVDDAIRVANVTFENLPSMQVNLTLRNGTGLWYDTFDVGCVWSSWLRVEVLDAPDLHTNNVGFVEIAVDADLTDGLWLWQTRVVPPHSSRHPDRWRAHDCDAETCASFLHKEVLRFPATLSMWTFDFAQLDIIVEGSNVRADMKPGDCQLPPIMFFTQESGTARTGACEPYCGPILPCAYVGSSNISYQFHCDCPFSSCYMLTLYVGQGSFVNTSLPLHICDIRLDGTFYDAPVADEG